MATVSLEEQETTISFCRTEQEAKIWTSDKTQWTKLDKLVETSDLWELKEEQKDQDGDVVAKVYVVKNKRLISYRSKITTPTLTEEQKQIAAERLRNIARNKVDSPEENVDTEN